jgi:hypothetical protein
MATKQWLCPKCESEHIMRRTHGDVCPACDGSGFLHNDIIESLKRFGLQHGTSLEGLLVDLKYDGLNKCFYFYFERHGMYHGVEYLPPNRGYIHT